MTDIPTQRPFVIEVTQRYLIWEEDWDNEGAERMLQRFHGAGDYYELIPQQSFDSDLDIRVADHNDLWASGDSECKYPLPQCAEPECTVLMYYPIGLTGDRCNKHKIDASP